MRANMAKRGKAGISFILASILIWAAISVIWLLPLPNILTKNFLTFCFAAILVPITFALSRIVRGEFSVKDDPLNNLGLLFSLNQILYLLIAIWAFSGAPEKMVVIIAVIFGAHLLPFFWLYRSRAYLVMAIAIPILITVVGWNLIDSRLFIIPVTMFFIEIIFSFWLFLENKRRYSVRDRIESAV